MRCFQVIIEGKLHWTPDGVENWEVPGSRPAGFFCTRYVFAQGHDDAMAKAIDQVRQFYEETTDWFVQGLLELELQIDQIRAAPFYKGFLRPNLGASFYLRAD